MTPIRHGSKMSARCLFFNPAAGGRGRDAVCSGPSADGGRHVGRPVPPAPVGAGDDGSGGGVSAPGYRVRYLVPPNPLNLTDGMALDGKGGLYITQALYNRIVRIDLQTLSLTVIADETDAEPLVAPTTSPWARTATSTSPISSAASVTRISPDGKHRKVVGSNLGDGGTRGQRRSPSTPRAGSSPPTSRSPTPRIPAGCGRSTRRGEAAHPRDPAPAHARGLRLRSRRPGLRPPDVRRPHRRDRRRRPHGAAAGRRVRLPGRPEGRPAGPTCGAGDRHRQGVAGRPHQRGADVPGPGPAGGSTTWSSTRTGPSTSPTSSRATSGGSTRPPGRSSRSCPTGSLTLAVLAQRGAGRLDRGGRLHRRRPGGRGTGSTRLQPAAGRPARSSCSPPAPSRSASDLYYSDFLPPEGGIFRVDRPGKRHLVASGFGFPWTVREGPGGQLLVSDQALGAVFDVDPRTGSEDPGGAGTAQPLGPGLRPRPRRRLRLRHRRGPGPGRRPGVRQGHRSVVATGLTAPRAWPSTGTGACWWWKATPAAWCASIPAAGRRTVVATGLPTKTVGFGVPLMNYSSDVLVRAGRHHRGERRRRREPHRALLLTHPRATRRGRRAASRLRCPSGADGRGR